jgi:hypothetical protein
MRVLVAKVIWRYKLSMTDGNAFTWESLRKMMIVEKDPLWLTLERRDVFDETPLESCREL